MMAFKNILLALAGKKEESDLVSVAAELTRQLNGRLSVIHINEPGAGKPHMMMDAPPSVEEKDILNLFDAAGLGKEADSVDINIVKSDSLEEKIAAATKEVDLLILGHSPKNRLLHALTETVDENITNKAKCPVLVVPKEKP
jgi:nucleotide-binding universal stress UspA family protein